MEMLSWSVVDSTVLVLLSNRFFCALHVSDTNVRVLRPPIEFLVGAEEALAVIQA